MGIMREPPLHCHPLTKPPQSDTRAPLQWEFRPFPPLSCLSPSSSDFLVLLWWWSPPAWTPPLTCDTAEVCGGRVGGLLWAQHLQNPLEISAPFPSGEGAELQLCHLLTPHFLGRPGHCCSLRGHRGTVALPAASATASSVAAERGLCLPRDQTLVFAQGFETQCVVQSTNCSSQESKAMLWQVVPGQLGVLAL